MSVYVHLSSGQVHQAGPAAAGNPPDRVSRRGSPLPEALQRRRAHPDPSHGDAARQAQIIVTQQLDLTTSSKPEATRLCLYF